MIDYERLLDELMSTNLEVTARWMSWLQC